MKQRHVRFMETLAKTSKLSKEAILAHWSAIAKRFELDVPPALPNETDAIDYSHVEFWTALATQGAFTLPEVVRIFRGQTPTDPRPNKDLYELPNPHDISMTTTVSAWNEIVRNGVRPRWLPDMPRRQATRPSNHRSSSTKIERISRHLRKGQLEGRYLLVKASMLQQWPEIVISPLAVVDKPGAIADDIRLINDYSFPPGKSANDYTDRSDHPSIEYNPPRAIAKRIHRLKQSTPASYVLLMLGDVAGAFRHIPLEAESVHMFGFIFEDILVIDLSCGFGWCGSPAYYSIAGKLVNHLYEFNGQPDRQYVGNVWCDDHTCVEINAGSRCFDADLALRRAMATVLGPSAINESKFTRWSTQIKALGLLWDTEAGCVSIPQVKIEKAGDRIKKLLAARSVSKTAMLKTIGSLRHVAACARPARAFLQRLQSTANSAPRFGSCQLSEPTRDDLRWFQAVLQHPSKFISIPVVHFADLSVPDVNVFMDASGDGLCALEPISRRYLRQKFSETETNELSINIRELRSAVLAVLHWGPQWQAAAGNSLTHVQFNIDNSSAVSWANRRASRHPTAQLYNRLLSLAEVQYNLACTAAHIPGKLNTVADAGSRAWDNTHPLFRQWTNLSASWSQDHVHPPFDDLWGLWDQCCVKTLWHALPTPSIDSTGGNGPTSAWPRWLTQGNGSRRLGYFATYCWAHGANQAQKGNQHSTILLKIASIKWFHRCYRDLELYSTPRLAMLLQGIKRLSSPRRKKQPITPHFLRLLRRTLDISRPHQRLLWGSVLIGYFFLLRRSEYLTVEGKRHFYCLKNQNVFFSDRHGKPVQYANATSVTMGLEGAKNDQFGRGAWRTMHSSGDKRLCPVRGLYHIKRARREMQIQANPHLCGNLSSNAVSKALKRTARSAGVPPTEYATHSIRIGGATALMTGGADRLSIKLLGRWASNCFEEYPRQSAKSSAGLSRRMVRHSEPNIAASN